eukprot:g3160.t1
MSSTPPSVWRRITSLTAPTTPTFPPQSCLWAKCTRIAPSTSSQPPQTITMALPLPPRKSKASCESDNTWYD